ncbi:MAG: SPOR domain-containing protein [Burkholderiaceae bacterium]|nr:SPOR domain-containing protein [Burkholderiaceae bacterium]
MNKQLGGTIVGLMIGVVLGLAVALAVAVYVTKTPPTFANKGPSHTAESDATESKKNKDWDPNTPLYGKNPARPAAPALPAASEAGAEDKAMPTVKPAATAATTAAKSDVKTDAKPDVKAASSDPLGDLLKAKSATKSSNPVTEPFMYFVQAGAFRTVDDAEAQRARLSLMGIDAKITEREQSGRTVFRVRSGPFNKEDDADKMKEKISAAGMDAALVRVQR